MKVLQFSGGMDSLACLHLLRNTKDLVVLTATTDGAYPERQAYLDRIASTFPHTTFKQVFGHRDLNTHGYPVDVVPIKYTGIGSIIQNTPLRYQSYIECCNRALWQPMEQATFQLGATDIYRGQRNEDHHKAPIRDGHVENGVTYHFPLELWTRDEVKHYLQLECPELIPEYYVNEKTSRDCMDCTAYLKDNTSRIRHLPHKEYSIVRLVLNQWRMDVEDETRW